VPNWRGPESYFFTSTRNTDRPEGGNDDEGGREKKTTRDKTRLRGAEGYIGRKREERHIRGGENWTDGIWDGVREARARIEGGGERCVGKAQNVEPKKSRLWGGGKGPTVLSGKDRPVNHCNGVPVLENRIQEMRIHYLNVGVKMKQEHQEGSSGVGARVGGPGPMTGQVSARKEVVRRSKNPLWQGTALPFLKMAR